MFLDTSALIPLYVPEADSFRCEAVVAGQNGLVVSELLIGELSCAMLAKQKNRLLTSDQYDAIMRQFGEHHSTGLIQLVPVNGGLVREATEVMQWVYPDVLLRTLDALHLATYLSVDAGPLFTRDRRMREAARRLNIPLADA